MLLSFCKLYDNAKVQHFILLQGKVLSCVSKPRKNSPHLFIKNKRLNAKKNSYGVIFYFQDRLIYRYFFHLFIFFIQ